MKIRNIGRHRLQKSELYNRDNYLLTNYLGGFSSTTLTGSQARNDHAVFMASLKAPTDRYNIISHLEEIVVIDGKSISLSSQNYVLKSEEKGGNKYLNQVKVGPKVQFEYQVFGVEITKSLVFKYSKNELVIKYDIKNYDDTKIDFFVYPHYQFTLKGENLYQNQEFKVENNVISSNGIELYTKTDLKFEKIDKKYKEDNFYLIDQENGRRAIGTTVSLNHLGLESIANGSYEISFSLDKNHSQFNEVYNENISRLESLVKQADFKEELAKELVVAADQFIVHRDSVDSKTIIAGYPFFGDWGRDTMYAVLGGCIATKRYDDCVGIFTTFEKYLEDGLMPNMFPELDNPPMYNTVDSSLLYIWAVYELYTATKDTSILTSRISIIESIISNYTQGTKFDIKLDKDNLLMAGSGFDQVTWMDVRYEDILPTPRHGKPVEVNAMWFNALMVLVEAKKLSNEDYDIYLEMATKTKQSFNEKFYDKKNRCLKDTVSGFEYDNQIRPNQVWALEVPFSPVKDEHKMEILNTCHKHLYTPYGMRSLSYLDPEFKPTYGGSHFNRDMTYHQGTVWTFPLGSYLIAILKANNYSKEAKMRVSNYVERFDEILNEGCIGQIAEIYDGLNPAESRGCFAQAWSVTEILRVFEHLNRNGI